MAFPHRRPPEATIPKALRRGAGRRHLLPPSRTPV